MTSLLTLQSTLGIAGVALLGVSASAAANVFLPKNARKADRYVFIWLVFDALIHFLYEGTFVYYSTFGRTVNTSTGIIADIWKEYALADLRWGVADPTTVAIEIITVLGAGPLCFYILHLLANNDHRGYFWLVVLSTAEIYGGWMTFSPEWLVGSPNLETSTFLNKWVYLFFMNFIWVIVPFFVLVHAFNNISNAFKATEAGSKRKHN
ncbi:ebpl-prov protein [Coprinopsis cinerea okayama7|uniref:Ebpl-prov protein n=1 Tax=Coprinopsis cinerea (strain Okayama-7 / 130 / ATCC MYA-4618 / FGSC 9003) TaxID=240176 RepID=A8NSN7_COPC7|nr:ebpl-prov protein [Coprinopsis cinerea okayama7\|eukprot:XP_001836053.1 ebpl-prov protein [Coprinopsis cinerea okayama7\